MFVDTQLEAQVTDTHSAELECAGVLDPNTPDLIRIRRLESMLSAVRLKTKDVQILMKHYEATLSPMKEEYYSYGAKVSTFLTSGPSYIQEKEEALAPNSTYLLH